MLLPAYVEIAVYRALLESSASEQGARMIDINIYGVHYGCKLTLPKMLQRGRGHLVNIASSAGKAVKWFVKRLEDPLVAASLMS